MDNDARISKEALELWGVRFPSEHEIAKIEAEKCALLRDQFARAALSLGGEFFHGYKNGCDSAEHIAEAAYQIADAMLKARANG